MSQPFWPQIEALKGKTIHSVDQKKAYTVADVTQDLAILHVHDGGKDRKIERVQLEPFWRKLTATGELSISDLKQVYTFNHSPAAALLAALPGVTTTTRPIHLYFRERK